MHDPEETTLLYEEISQMFRGLILNGGLRTGAKLPSVRQLSRDRGVSIATILSAYLQLEKEGLVEARAKSGYFVRHLVIAPQKPRSVKLRSVPSKVSVTEAVETVMSAMRDPAIVPLGSGVISPALLPIRALNQTLAALAKEMGTAGGSYDPPPGLLTLRKQLSRRALSWGCVLHEDNFVTTCGATEAMQLALKAITKAGDTVAVESPTYFGLLQLIENLGLRVIEIPVEAPAGMRLDALEDALKRTSVRCILSIPNFHNPMGTCMPDENKEKLAALLHRYDVPLIEDDVFGDLAFDGTRPRPVKAFDKHDRVLLCGSVSKTLAPGYRVGWIAGGRYQRQIERLKYSHSISTATLPQMAVAEFLAKGGYDRHLRGLRAKFAQNTQRIQQHVAIHFPAGTSISTPAGSYFLWVDLPASIDTLELQQHALAHQIAVAPGPIFSARSKYSSSLRINCGFGWDERLAQAIQTVGRLASEQVTARKRAAN